MAEWREILPSDEQWLYRRVPRAWFKPKTSEFPQIDVFLPTKQDTHGLSVMRPSLITPAVAAHAHGKRAHILRIETAQLLQRGLHVYADKPDDPAHALITDLNRPAYEQNKAQFKALADQLVRIGQVVLVALPPEEFPDP